MRTASSPYMTLCLMYCDCQMDISSEEAPKFGGLSSHHHHLTTAFNFSGYCCGLRVLESPLVLPRSPTHQERSEWLFNTSIPVTWARAVNAVLLYPLLPFTNVT